MIRLFHIVGKSISAATVTALIVVYLTPAMKVFCSVDNGRSMPCCTSETGSGSCASQNSDNVSIKSAHKCPCPSMQSGPDKSFDEILPNAGKADLKDHSSDFTYAPSESYMSSVLNSVSTAYVHSYLSARERLSLLQSFLI